CQSPTLQTCGMAGAACVACNPAVADACVTGSCRCGAGPSCVAGQRCNGGRCICDGMSCPNGCCAGVTCATPSFGSCGGNGNACASCNGTLADSCTNGVCTCSGNPACVAGQRCRG